MTRHIPCSHCGQKFHDEVGRWAHARMRHPGKKNPRPRFKNDVNGGPSHHDDEPSMADLFIEAQLNRAMGIENEDWIEDMMP